MPVLKEKIGEAKKEIWEIHEYVGTEQYMPKWVREEVTREIRKYVEKNEN